MNSSGSETYDRAMRALFGNSPPIRQTAQTRGSCYSIVARSMAFSSDMVQQRADLRAEQLKRIAAEGVPMLVVHPILESVLPYYEIDMAAANRVASFNTTTRSSNSPRRHAWPNGFATVTRPSARFISSPASDACRVATAAQCLPRWREMSNWWQLSPGASNASALSDRALLTRHSPRCRFK